MIETSKRTVRQFIQLKFQPMPDHFIPKTTRSIEVNCSSQGSEFPNSELFFIIFGKLKCLKRHAQFETLLKN